MFEVGKKTGWFSKITLVVKDSDLDLDDFIVTFANGDKFEPKTRHNFRQGSRTKAIDLPGDVRIINKITLIYANRAGGGRARVELYGHPTAKPNK